MLIKPTKTEAEKPIKNGFKPSVNIFLRFVCNPRAAIENKMQ